MSSPHQSVPPPESSHNPAAAEVTGGKTAPPGPRRVIRTTGLSYLGVFILAMCVFFPIVGWPAGLFWLALLPLAALVWIVRTQTTVSPAGLDVRSVFSSRHIDWAQVKGLSIPKRGFVRVHLDDDSEVPLPAVSYDRLRDLVDASGGRIPDPFAVPEPAPADDATDAAAGADATSEAPTTEATAADDATSGKVGTGHSAPAEAAADDTASAHAPAADVTAGNAKDGAAATDRPATSDAAADDPATCDAATDDPATRDAATDDAAAGDAVADRPAAGDSSPTSKAADTRPGPTSERE